jgi:hypothetical protein
MHFRIMEGDPLDIFTQKDTADTAPGSQPDLAPRNFLLFGYVKREFTG